MQKKESIEMGVVERDIGRESNPVRQRDVGGIDQGGILPTNQTQNNRDEFPNEKAQ
jgi:hypothetical protein